MCRTPVKTPRPEKRDLGCAFLRVSEVNLFGWFGIGGSCCSQTRDEQLEDEECGDVGKACEGEDG